MNRFVVFLEEDFEATFADMEAVKNWALDRYEMGSTTDFIQVFEYTGRVEVQAILVQDGR